MMGKDNKDEFISFKPNQEQDAWSMPIAYLKRLDNLLMLADQSAVQEDSRTWFKLLKSIYRNISGFLKDDEKEHFLFMQIQIEKTFPTKIKNIPDLIKLEESIKYCEELDEWIRAKMHTKGLIMPNKKDMGEIILG